MKRFFYSLMAMFVMAYAVVSCDEANNTTEGYFEGIFTVEGKAVIPEMQDTFYNVKNSASFGLKDGDRAMMRVKYFIDNVYGPQMAEWSIDRVYGRIKTRELTPAALIDSAAFTSPLSDIRMYIPYGSQWVWNGLQNINVVSYTNGIEPEYRMTVDGFANDTLALTLFAKVDDGDIEKTTLLSYEIAAALPMLSNVEQQAAKVPDTIYTRISTLYYYAAADTVQRVTVYGGKCANPFK